MQRLKKFDIKNLENLRLKNQTIVSKFGGVCMASPLNISRVVDVIKSNKNRKIIVVSAPGQIKDSDIKITDLLYKCCDSITNSNDNEVKMNSYFNKTSKENICDDVLFQIEKVFIDILDYFKLNQTSLKNEILKIKKIIDDCKTQISKNKLCNNFKSFIASRGEFLMAKILAEIIDYDFIDAIEIIKFKSSGELDIEKTYDLIRNKLNLLKLESNKNKKIIKENKIIKDNNTLKRKSQHKIADLSLYHKKGIIVPGFYGQLPNGEILTFSRGGSDYTASLIAAALNVELYENWKDVAGLMSCDPKVVKSSLNIPEITFNELRQLSYMGSKILHPDTVLPVCEKDIPIVIKSIFKPKNQGTVIRNYIDFKNIEKIKAITVKKNQVCIKLKKVIEYNEVDFYLSILKVLKNFNIISITFQSNIDYINLFFNQKELEFNEKELLFQLRKLNLQKIILMKDISLVTIVGEKIAYKSHVFNQILNCLSEINIKIKFIKVDSNGSNIILAVKDEQFRKAITALHELLFLSKL